MPEGDEARNYFLHSVPFPVMSTKAVDPGTWASTCSRVETSPCARVLSITRADDIIDGCATANGYEGVDEGPPLPGTGRFVHDTAR
jgi:hypothetical protein